MVVTCSVTVFVSLLVAWSKPAVASQVAFETKKQATNSHQDALLVSNFQSLLGQGPNNAWLQYHHGAAAATNGWKVVWVPVEDLGSLGGKSSQSELRSLSASFGSLGQEYRET